MRMKQNWHFEKQVVSASCVLQVTIGMVSAQPLANTESALSQERNPADNKVEKKGSRVPSAGYDRGFFIQSEDGWFRLQMQGRLHTRYSVVSTDSAGAESRQTETSLSVPLARLFLTGNLFGQKLSFVLQPEFGSGHVRLMLAFGDVAFIPKVLHLTFGQFKRPYSRDFIAPCIKRAFIYSPTGEMGQGADIGIQLSNNYTKVSGVEWAIGVFNSDNPTRPRFKGTVITDENGQQTVEGASFSNSVKNFSPAIVARIGYNNGIKGYWPTDFEGGPPRFGIALSGFADLDVDRDDTGEIYLSGDLALKAFGLSLGGAVYAGFAAQGEPWSDPVYTGFGSFGRVGYFFAEHFEPVIRYGVMDPSGSENRKQEVTVGFTFYFYKQVFKLENNFSVLLEQSGDLNHYRYASQLQLLF